VGGEGREGTERKEREGRGQFIGEVGGRRGNNVPSLSIRKDLREKVIASLAKRSSKIFLQHFRKGERQRTKEGAGQGGEKRQSQNRELETCLEAMKAPTRVGLKTTKASKFVLAPSQHSFASSLHHRSNPPPFFMYLTQATVFHRHKHPRATSSSPILYLTGPTLSDNKTILLFLGKK
jgi:hypothetical protein